MSAMNTISIKGREIKVAPASMKFFESLMPTGAKVAVKGADGKTFGLRKWETGKVTVMRDKNGDTISGADVKTRW